VLALILDHGDGPPRDRNPAGGPTTTLAPTDFRKAAVRHAGARVHIEVDDGRDREAVGSARATRW